MYRKPKSDLNRINQFNYRKRIRRAVIEILGKKCSKCGFEDVRALQIDHINGGGCQERATLGTCGYYIKVMKSFTKGENKYQLLCANCNWIKRIENGESRKSKINFNLIL